MHQIQFLLGLRARFPWGAYSAPQILLAYLRGLLLRGKEGASRRRVREVEGKGRRRERTGEVKSRGEKEGRGGKGEEGREGKRKGFAGPMSNCFLRA